MANTTQQIIAPARIPADLADVRALFQEYANSLGFDLCFQGFQEELARLPGEYSDPSGALLVVRNANRVTGCVGLRRLEKDICEMKRLYVQPRARGGGLGRRLAEAAIIEARRKSYCFMRLDTVPSMKEAITLYESLGFVRIAPYRRNPIEGAVFMELTL